MPFSQTLPGDQDTALVTFTIKINGEDVGTQYQVASISITNEINRIPSAKIMIYDGNAAEQDFSISNEETFIPCSPIEIWIGYNNDEEQIFSGIIIKHSLKIRNDSSPLLILECRDNAIKMTIARKNKYFYNQKDSDVFSDIIGTYGLSSNISDTQATLESIVQYDCTDWDFIVSRLDANSMYCYVNAGSITIAKPDFNRSTVLDAVFGATIYEFDAGLDVRNQYEALNASTWDQANQQINTVTANAPDIEENGNLSGSDLASSFGTSEYDVFAGEELTENELQSLADSMFQKAVLSRCRGRVRFRGYGSITPGNLINIGGVGERFNGKVFVSGVRQEVANGNWTTDVQFGLSNESFTTQPEVNSLPAAGMLPMINGLQIGIVTELENDPDGENRIRVRLPIIDPNEDGIWSRIATLDAGNNRGTFFLPEIGDEVIVGFLNNDPRYAVILGMLNSSAKPAPLQASDQNDEKGYISRSGIKMIFNDSDNSLIIQTPAGKKVTLDESSDVVSLEDEHGNSVSMNASSLTIQSAVDMNLTANGTLAIKGTMVTIN
ncbi:MAG: type VI secretion system tip protein VgrG [Mucilaginibacter sp.]